LEAKKFEVTGVKAQGSKERLKEKGPEAIAEKR
jgi:hypothetical protein